MYRTTRITDVLSARERQFCKPKFLRQVIGAVGFKLKVPILAEGFKVMESLVSDTDTLKSPLPRIFCQNWDSFWLLSSNSRQNLVKPFKS